MDPKSANSTSAVTGGDIDVITLAQKRSRRVSFAETTAVYVFDRDEDFETPPDWEHNQNEESFSSLLKFSSGIEEEEEDFVFQPEYSDSEEDDNDVQEKFICDMDSSSPGSVAGSVTSNDDDNFFGPVSTSFIKSGRLSDQDEMIQSIGLAEDEQNNTLSPSYRRPLDDLISQSDQDPFVLSQTKLMRTPDKEEPLSLKVKLIQHGERISAIKIPKSHKSPIISGFMPASSEKNRMLPEQNCLDGYYASQVSVASKEKENFATIDKENVRRNTIISPIQLSQSDMNENNTCLAFNSYSERASEHDECSHTVDVALDTKASPIQMLGSKLYRSEGGCISPKVNGTDNQNNLSDKLCPKNLVNNDGFLYQNKEQIKMSMDFQSGVRGCTKSSEKKRGIDQMLHTVKDNLNEESRIQKIPRIFSDGVTSNSNSITAYDVECSDESMNMGDQTPQKYWKDMFTKAVKNL